MDLFLKQASYAEDQQFSRSILTIHVLHRGLNFGAVVGISASLVRSLIKSNKQPFSSIITGASRGSTIGLGLSAIALTGRMIGRDLIEWQDRSWRLLGHPTQIQTDHWSIAGMVLGAATASLYTSATGHLSLFQKIVGGAGFGSSMAIVAMLGYRAVAMGSKQKFG